ncbi:hypothetical protein COY25_04305 [Candidatus Uhrbacteria bacterium CG_4_10_14_0_2_um_filter_41_7]|nr:MAG: hypothetical protein COY25_04305 [Candidatus Uhrbacteria bacterium CG_4_10_14_0_2_um_filter_41_7]
MNRISCDDSVIILRINYIKKQTYAIFAILGSAIWLFSEIFILLTINEGIEVSNLALIGIVYFFGMISLYIGAPLSFLVGKIVSIFGANPYAVYPTLYPLLNTLSVLILVFVGLKIYSRYKKS